MNLLHVSAVIPCGVRSTAAVEAAHPSGDRNLLIYTDGVYNSGSTKVELLRVLGATS